MTSEEERVCSSCTSTIPKSGYSNTQWSKSSSISKCKYCVAAGGPPAITTSEEGATGEDILDYDDEDDGTSYIGTVLNTNTDIDAPPPPKHDEDDLDNNNTTPSSPTKKTDVFYATSSGLSNWNARMAALSQSKLSSKDHDKLDGVHLSKVVDQSERSTDTATNNNAVEEKLENELEKKQQTPQEQLAKVKQPSSDEQQLEESDDGISMKEGLDIKQSFITSQKNKNKSGRLSHVSSVSLVSVDMPEEEEHQNIHTKDNKEDQVNDQGIGQGVSGAQQEDYQQQVVVMTEDELLEAQFSGGGGLIGEGISTITYYGRQPSITDRTKRIVRQSSEKFGSGMKRLFRRPVPTSSSAAATGVLQDNSNSSSSYSSKGAYDNMEGNNKKQQDVVRTEVTDESDDEEEEEEEGTTTTTTNNNYPTTTIGSLLKDTYSFIYIYPACPPSAPFMYAIFLFLFQSLVYALLLSSLIDTSNPNNVLHVPYSSVTLSMRIAQGCAILIAVVNSVDIMVAMNNLLRVPDEIVVVVDMTEEGAETRGLLLSAPSLPTSIHNSTELSSIQSGIAHSRTDVSGSVLASAQSSSSNHYSSSCAVQSNVTFPAGMKFKFANVLRLIEGILALTASFILIVRSSDIIDMFINFAALEFVVNLDNLAFALAEHGLISDRLQDAARFVSGLGFSYKCHHTLSNDVANRRTRKRRKDSCSAGHLAHVKGSFIARLFGRPATYIKNHPDGTRRTTLFIMAATLYGVWAVILAGLSGGQFLCKSLDVDFFHAHSPNMVAAADEGGLRSFLVSRSGLYVAILSQEDDNQSLLTSMVNLVTGNRVSLAYRKVDMAVESPAQMMFQANSLIPNDYVDVIYYDQDLQRWIFTACDPKTYTLPASERVCMGHQVHSFETDAVDLMALSSSPIFHIVDDKDLFDTSLALPAIITCNECGRQNDGTSGAVNGDVLTCGISGGECSDPQEEYGWRRQCVCPTGQYGPYCQEHYGASCTTLEIIPIEGVEEPPGAVKLANWELRGFTLVKDKRGVGNSPVWERSYISQGLTDRLEFREGMHWVITRTQDSLDISHTLAIADGTSSIDGDNGMATGLMNQPQPSGLTFYAPKSAQWGVHPDYLRPYASYRLHCKGQLTSAN